MNEEIFYIIPENKSEWCQRNLTMIQFPLNVYKLFFATIPNIYYWNAYNPKYCYNFWIKLLCLYQSILSNRTTVFSVAKELNTVEPRLCIDYRLSVPSTVIHLSSLNRARQVIHVHHFVARFGLQVVIVLHSKTGGKPGFVSLG